MKARIKKTGEIIDVTFKSYSPLADLVYTDGKRDFCSRDLEIMKSETSKDGECITIPKERYHELLDYESLALWFLNLIIVSSLPNIEMNKEKLKELSNNTKYKAVQDMLKETLKAKGE